MSDLFSGPDPADAWDRRIEAEEGDSLPTVDGIYVSDVEPWSRVKVTRVWKHDGDNDHGVAFEILDRLGPDGRPITSHSALSLKRFNEEYRPEGEPLTKERFMEIHNMTPGDGLRELIAGKMHHQMPGCTHDEHGADCLILADAVMAVVHPFTDKLATALAETEAVERRLREQHDPDVKRIRELEEGRANALRMVDDLLVQRMDERAGRRRAERAIECVKEYAETTDDDGIRTRENILRLLGGET